VSGTYSSLDRAQEVRTLVNEGHIRTTSVAFMTKKVTKGGQARTVRELLNGAFVAIPSNREALVVNSKNAKTEEGRTVAIAQLHVDSKKVAQLVVEQLNAEGKTISGATVAVKTVDGSYEQRQQAISDALDALYPDPPDGYVYAWPLATFDATVVYRVGGNTDLRGQWQASYTVNDDGTIALGEPERVQMVEVVKPVDGAAPKGFRLTAAPKNFDLAEVDAPAQDEQTKSAAASAAAAPAEGAAAAGPAADTELALRLRGLLATASAYATD
jgi:hypothetical protein